MDRSLNYSLFGGVENVDSICDVGELGRAVIQSTQFKSQSSYNFRRGRRIANILEEMLGHLDFRGMRILELGPGHYAFALLARHLGAEVVCIESDPTFVSLGRNLGFEVVQKNFFELDEVGFNQKFDGLFVKGTFNACNVADVRYINRFVEKYTALLKDDGWGWFVTVNKSKAVTPGVDLASYVAERIELQRYAFEENGWDSNLIPDDFDRARYAMNYSGSKYLFTKNLELDI